MANHLMVVKDGGRDDCQLSGKFTGLREKSIIEIATSLPIETGDELTATRCVAQRVEHFQLLLVLVSYMYPYVPIINHYHELPIINPYCWLNDPWTTHYQPILNG